MKKYLIVLVLLAGCGSPFVGKTGPTGPAGPQGLTGASGTSCSTSSVQPSSVAANGGVLISCPDGSQSLVLNGSNGTNGTVVTPVQFCAGVVNSYPSTFPEVGFCINNNIYAVYSANGGFLTEISPGLWQSNAIGSACNFTVGPNCSITN